METALTILYIVICIALVVIVLLQKGKNAGMSGAVDGGSSETFFGKNKSKTRNARLEKITAVAAVLFVVLAIVLSIFLKGGNTAENTIPSDQSIQVGTTEAPAAPEVTESVVTENPDAQ